MRGRTSLALCFMHLALSNFAFSLLLNKRDRMKKLIFIILIQGYLMGATLFKVDVDGVKVPVVFEEDKSLPLASVEFIFKDSGVLASSKAGLVTLSSSLLNEGTKAKGSQKFASELEDRAINLSASSGNETFVFTIDSLKEQFNYGLDKLIELLKDPNYTEDTFKKIVTKRVGVLTRKESDYDYTAKNGLKSILFKGSNLALPRLGSVESIKSIKLDDIKNYINTHLYLDNLIVVVGGDFDKKEIEEFVKKVAKNLKRGKVEPLPYITPSDIKEHKEVNRETQQAYIYFGAPYNMKISDKERVVGQVASFILGSSGFGSRMMEEIRVKRGLAYSAYSRFIVGKTSSYLFGYLQTKLKTQDEATKLVQEIIDNFVKNGVTKEELESAKKFYLGYEPLSSETLPQRVHRAFDEYYSGAGLGFSKEKLKIIQNLTLDELNKFIKEHKEIANLSVFTVTNKKK